MYYFLKTTLANDAHQQSGNSELLEPNLMISQRRNNTLWLIKHSDIWSWISTSCIASLSITGEYHSIPRAGNQPKVIQCPALSN